MSAGTCRYCACTDDHACAAGCAWPDDARTVCSQCEAAADLAARYLDIIAAVFVRQSIFARTVSWVDIPDESRQLLVMTCRAVVEHVRDAVVAQVIEAREIGALESLAEIQGFLEQHFSSEFRADETPAQLVERLLTPHAGSRIVLP